MLKLPISAIIFCYNEAQLLEPCLSSVQFCKEIIVVDLGSTDRSVEIAQKYATLILHNERVLEPASVKSKITCKATYDWILYIDPDERIDKSLKDKLITIFENLTPSIAGISVPWQFYFKEKPLYGTFWGMKDSRKTILVNRTKVIVPEVVHKGISVIDNNNRIYDVIKDSNEILHHYWMDSYAQLIDKHKRYLKLEGEAKYKAGWRYSVKKQIKHFFTAFYDSFIIYRGWRDGFIGLFLSFFYAWYNYNIWNSLKKYEQLRS